MLECSLLLRTRGKVVVHVYSKSDRNVTLESKCFQMNAY